MAEFPAEILALKGEVHTPAEGVDEFVVPLVSSALNRISYTAEGVLRVHFHSGAVHDYPETPPAAFVAFATAESPGRYFSQHIRVGKKPI
jgi:hypothetical protein